MYQLCQYWLSAPLYMCMSSNWYFSLLIKGFPHWWCHGYPYDIIGGNSLSNNNRLWYQHQYLFVYFATILKLFSFLIHASIFLLVRQLNCNLFKTITVILNYNILLSPKICQYFSFRLTYVNNYLRTGLKFLQRNVSYFEQNYSIWAIQFLLKTTVCIKPLRNRLEAIQKLQHPITPKGCRSFMGMVNFLSMSCPELQILLKPIYDLTTKR